MFRWLTARLGRKRRKLTDQELAQEEAIRRQAEEEVRRAETLAAEHRQRIDSTGGTGGWSGW